MCLLLAVGIDVTTGSLIPANIFLSWVQAGFRALNCVRRRPADLVAQFLPTGP
jgi:hypothetical protein